MLNIFVCFVQVLYKTYILKMVGGMGGGGGGGQLDGNITDYTSVQKKRRYKMKQHKGVQHCLKYELQLEKQRDQHFSVKYLEYVIYVHTSKNRKQKTVIYNPLMLL